MKERITGVLDYARIQDESVSFVRVDLEAAAKSCLSDLSFKIEEANADITIEDLPDANGVESLVSRVFQSIISNSLKYRRQSHPCRIVIRSASAPNGMVCVRIEDNGIGIPSEHRKKVFELFARLHTNDEISGRGLGLSLCERIVSRHGGTIHAEEGIEGGAALVFNLPEAE